MMRNGRSICLGVLCVLFITSTVFAQSQSATETTIEKIYESEGRVRDHVDAKVEGIETKIETLSTTVGTLSTDVAVNKTNIANMQNDIRDLKGTVGWIWKGTLAILISIVGYFLRSLWQNQGKKDNVDVVDRLTEQITRLTSAQAKTLELISAQAKISETRNVAGHPQVPSVEELDELTEDIRSTRHDVGERL